MTNEKIKTLEETAKMTLGFKPHQDIIGANSAYSEFGKQGESAYENFMNNSKDVKKIQEETYQKRKQQYKANGIVGEPSYFTYGDVTAQIKTQDKENKPFVLLGDLEKIVKQMTNDFKFTLPKNLKNYSYAKLGKIAKEKEALDEKTGEVDYEKLSPEEQEAFAKYNILSEAYDKACSKNILDSNYFAELNYQEKAINEKYHPKPKEDNNK